MKKRLFLPIIFILFFILETISQNDYKFGLYHRLLFNDFGSKLSDATVNPKGLPRGMELSFSKKIKNNLRINLPLRMGFTKSPDDTTTLGRTFWGGDILIQFEYPKYRFVPYIATGMGIHNRLSKTDFGLPTFVGLNFRIEEGFSLNIQTGYRLSFSEGKSSWHHGIGLVFNLGKIPSKKTSPSVQMLRHAEIVESLDIIGWWQVPHLSILIAKTALPETFDFPMSDMDDDNVPDNIDDCPKVYGLANNKGCPAHDDLSWLSGANTIAFEFGQSALLQESYAFLDKIVLFFEKQPQLKLSIQGHTDNRGSTLFNQKLSERRAKTCFDYLLSKGLRPEVLAYTGFGENQPIADNRTEIGRHKNRRVLFTVIQ
jgi:outer membrane protein OmpA-like peptidoglycan-associated protein